MYSEQAALLSRPAPSAAPALKVAVIGHIRHPIAAPFMGGMEAHCAGLCEGLAAAGHHPVLFAPAGSDVACEQVTICDAPYEDVLPWATWRGTPELDAYQGAAFDRALEMIAHGDFDVVHNNSLYPGLIAYAAQRTIAMVTSQHVPPFAAMRDEVGAARGLDHVRFTVTSAAQLPLWFDDVPANMVPVHNGVDCDFWRPSPARIGRGTRIAWTGRITPNKGTALAVRAARMAGAALDIAGSVEDENYFRQEIEPMLGGAIRYRGHLEGEELRDLVAGAAALCVTPMWEEPFGLVAAEALACDMPVIAFDRGAMREVVGDCGALIPADDVDSLARALADPPRLARGKARARAQDRFCTARMIEGYVREYRLAIAGRARAA
jgi:glycosyltransferase involved in cell wall biosynthesis